MISKETRQFSNILLKFVEGRKLTEVNFWWQFYQIE